MANRTGNMNAKFANRNRRGNINLTKKLAASRLKARNKVMDARQKILLKKRTNVKDAREVLSKMSRVQDARSKLLKMRETKKNGSIRAIGSNILQKTDSNGKISLMTSKNKQNTSNMNLAIQQELGLVSQSRRKPIAKRSPTITNKISPRNVPLNLVRKTIFNDLDYHPSLQSSFDPYIQNYLSANNLKLNLARSRLPIEQIMDTPLTTRRHQLQLAKRNSLLNDGAVDWNSYMSPFNRNRLTNAGYIDLDAPDDEEMPYVSPPKQNIFMQIGSSQSTNVHSRLDTPPVQSQSHGIFAHPTRTKVIVPAGHRIVVSNLQQTVTQDDIRELFEDIGQLLVARLVRPGTAEVIYKNYKDAQKAVDTYHNRQLDGQPMKCLLVNKRPIDNPTGPAIAPTQDTTAIVSSLNKKTGTAKPAEKLIPDLQTIHKVLFQRN